MRNEPDQFPCWTYQSLVIDEGIVETLQYACADAPTREAMLALINRWNSSGRGVWQFWLLEPLREVKDENVHVKETGHRGADDRGTASSGPQSQAV